MLNMRNTFTYWIGDESFDFTPEFMDEELNITGGLISAVLFDLMYELELTQSEVEHMEKTAKALENAVSALPDGSTIDQVKAAVSTLCRTA